MIGNTLGQIVEMVRSEARQSTNTSRGTDNLDNIKQLIKRHYQMLLDEFDWQHLTIKRHHAVKDLLPNSQFYDFPEMLNTDRIENVWVYHGNMWLKLDYGIDYDELNCHDSDMGESSTHPLRWDYYGHDQFEVWPMPTGVGVKVAFEGQRKVEPLINNNSKVYLDDIMISLFVASEILAANNQKDAKIKNDKAEGRRLQMRSGKGSHKRIAVGRGEVGNGGVYHPREIKSVR